MMSMLNFVNFLANANVNGVSTITDEGLNTALSLVSEIVGTVTLVIYIVLGFFLVVKGAILGMQIVKAADEPQVRQEKIGSLKWLVIGVAIAYAVTIAADLLTGYFAGAFGVKK